jgi:hypothetical protein
MRHSKKRRVSHVGPGQKTLFESDYQMPGFRPFSSDAPAWPESILFGQAGFILLRGPLGYQPCQCLAVVPRHPLRWTLLQLLGMPQ